MNAGRFNTGRPAGHDRGSIYLLVLGAAMLVTVIGLSSLLVARVEHRAATRVDDGVKARGYAESAMELAMLLVNTDPNWRTVLGNSNWPTNEKIGDGYYTIAVSDKIDGFVDIGGADPVEITAIGMQGDAVQKLRATVCPYDPTQPLELFDYGLLAGSGLVILVGREARADNGAAICTNTSVMNNGTIRGDIEAGSAIVNNGSITGIATAPVPLKPLPPSWVFNTYKDIATPISNPGTIDLQVLAPGLNPWGPTNGNGVYYIDAGNTTLTIRNSRIHGTLVVQCGPTGRVRVEGTVLMHEHHPNFPTLIVDGDVELSFASDPARLDEVSLGANFNPPGAPYNGDFDGDLSDDYSSEIQGFSHVRGQLLMEATSEFDGVALCETTVTIDGDAEFNWMPDNGLDPPFGYTTVGPSSPMIIVPGSWKQVVD